MTKTTRATNATNTAPAHAAQSLPAAQSAKQPLDRRTALGVFAGAAGVVGALGLPRGAPAQTELPKPIFPKSPAGPASLNVFDETTGEYVLPPLPYDFKALEPHIDAKTMELHHGKHHAAYVAGANKALKELAAARGGGDVSLVKHWARELSFHLGGHLNHALFWSMMAPAGDGPGKGGGEPAGTLGAAITKDFESFSQFAAHFKANATQVEGNGWGWLVYEPFAKKLLIVQMQNQQDRFVTGTVPILGIDVWEHAYYLTYQNKRSDYVQAFMNVVRWDFCQRLFDAASRGV